MKRTIRIGAGLLAAAAVTVSGVATAYATAGHDKPAICHPVEGNGETGTGWNLISPDEASKHIDEATGAGLHTRKDGRTDVYAVDGVCPGTPDPEPTTTSPTTEPTKEPTSSPTTSSPTTEPEPTTSSPTSPPATSSTTSPPSTTTQPPVTSSPNPGPIPDPVVEHRSWFEVNCEVGETATTTTTITTPYELVDGGWVLDPTQAWVEEVTEYADATPAECPRPTRDVVRPTTKTQWHLPSKTSSTDPAPAVTTPVTQTVGTPVHTELAHTGAALTGGLVGLLLIVGGASVYYLRHRWQRQH